MISFKEYIEERKAAEIGSLLIALKAGINPSYVVQKADPTQQHKNCWDMKG